MLFGLALKVLLFLSCVAAEVDLPGVAGLNSISPTDGVPKFVLHGGEITCAIVQADLELYVSYFTDNSSQSIEAFLITEDALVEGQCGDEYETFTLNWTPNQSNSSFNLTWTILKLPNSPSKSGGSVVRNISFAYFLSKDIFPHTNESGRFSAQVNGSFFETPGDMGFTCASQKNISLSEHVILGVSSLHLETFRSSNSTDFGKKVLDCTNIPTPNPVVPIIVGVTAVILILLAIGAFLIVNRRRAQGYQSL